MNFHLLKKIIPDTDVSHSFRAFYRIDLITKNSNMLGELSVIEIEELLHKQIVGRIGCHDRDLVYVVPISYAYDDNCIYCHTYEGKKIDIMRNNPKVCFQVDEMKDMANWRSVMAWGEFQELSNQDERTHALLILLHRQLPARSSITTHLGKSWPFTPAKEDLNKIPGITFRISLTEKTGRFESTSESHMLA